MSFVSKVAIIICTFEETTVLKEVIHSIYKFKNPELDYDYIIVDNSLTNNVQKLIKNCFPDFRYFRNPLGGFGRANNIGAANSDAEVIFFVNPDLVLLEDVFLKISLKLLQSPEVGIAGLRLLNRNLTPNMSFYWSDFNGIISDAIIKLLNYFNLFINKHMFLSGSFIAITRENFFKIGAFDEKIMLYYEELDLNRRQRQHNLNYNYFGKLRAIHLGGTTTSFDLLAKNKGLESLVYYSKKYDLDVTKVLSAIISKKRITRLLNFLSNEKKIRISHEILFYENALFKIKSDTINSESKKN